MVQTGFDHSGDLRSCKTNRAPNDVSRQEAGSDLSAHLDCDLPVGVPESPFLQEAKAAELLVGAWRPTIPEVTSERRQATRVRRTRGRVR